MQVALIPPLGWEKYLEQSDLCLALAIPDLIDNERYWMAYRHQSNEGKLVILDNGLAEGHVATGMQIQRGSEVVCAREIVLPDVMGDKSATLEKIRNFIGNVGLKPNMQYMAVVQGQSLKEVKLCIDSYAEREPITTLGIPRWMVSSDSFNRSVRIDLARYVHETYGNRFKIHLLGTNPVWVSEVKAAARYAPFIRSVDTSMPFNYAMRGQLLANAATAQTARGGVCAIKRPSGYFDRIHSFRSDLLVEMNIRFLKYMAYTLVASDV